MPKPYDDFLLALRLRESGDNYQIVNTYGYLGAYQFGEAALIDLGLLNPDGDDYDNNFSGGFTGKFGVYSVAQFLASQAAQDAAADEWFPLMWKYLTAAGLHQYLGQIVGGIEITASALLAGAHLLGTGNVQIFLQSGGTIDPKDAYGTPISEYMTLFGGYEMPFDTGEAFETQFAATIMDDALTGTTGDDQADLLGGNDIFHGQSGNDVLDGGAGRDALYGGDGADDLRGGSGNDLLKGGNHADTLYGGANNDRLFGEGGNDTLYGEGGYDRLMGGAGNDTLNGGDLVDVLFGGAGDDQLYGENGYDKLLGDDGSDHLFGGRGNDALFGGKDGDLLSGEIGDDKLFGEEGHDTLDGGRGNDVLFGGDGRDTLWGGDGDDTLYGNNGSDILNGGAGNDILRGGFGSDTFVFADGFGTDQVVGFDATDDLEKIDLAGVGSIGGYADLTQNHMTQVGGNVLIDDGLGNSITLLKVDIADLDANDFLF